MMKQKNDEGGYRSENKRTVKFLFYFAFSDAGQKNKTILSIYVPCLLESEDMLPHGQGN
jgi:hypothetical protein